MNSYKLKLRVSAVFSLFLALYVIIALNLYYIQIYQANFFSQLAAQQYNVNCSKTPPRALIYDRNQKPLAINQDCLSTFILPNQINSPETLKPFLLINFPRAYEQLQNKSHKHFMYIKRNLSETQQELIHAHKIADIQLLHEPHRFYPTPTTALIVGMTDIDNKGLFGLELQYDKKLSGIPTAFNLNKDARSGYFYFKKETTSQGEEGTSIKLTIDSDLQFLVHETVKDTVQKFEALEGSAIVMNPNNGEILAMVTYPHFDPYDMEKLNLELTKNKVLTEAYELGSAMKTFVALAALQEGVVTPDELIDCKNTKTTYIDGRKINTTVPHGVISFAEVIARSNNIGIAIVAKRLDKKLFDHYTRIGFGQKTGIEFPGENKGFVNPPTNWSKQSIISLSYGYEISVTLLQLACGFCMIANNGYPIVPRITLDNEQNQSTTEQLYEDEHIQAIKDILAGGAKYGTSKRAHIDGYRIMCKTGTANILINGQYNKEKNLFTCAGIVEKEHYENYKRVIVTFIRQAKEQRLYASTVAAPLFERIAQHVIIHDKVI